MRLFLRRIQSETNHEELQKFLAQACRWRWYWPFRESGVVTECKILKVEDGGCVEYHGLAEIQPEHAALRATIVVNGKPVGGRIVEVRKWYDRAKARERRRSVTLAPIDLPFSDRRGADRRRSNLAIEMS